VIVPEAVTSLWTGPREDPRRYRVDLADEGLVSEGDGGEGLVYRAIRTVDGVSEEVALKMLTTLTLDDYERLAERASVLTHIHSPHIMRQLDTFIGPALPPGEEDFRVLYSVAEWIPGEPLADALVQRDRHEGLRWVAQIARAVDDLHSYRGSDAPAGVLHRDIKPSNVRITPDDQAVLIDFGVARPQSESDLTDGVGTFLWRAPEVVGGPGKPGLQSDNWGVGALAYWVLIGEAPRLEGPAAVRERLYHAARKYAFPDPVGLSGHIAALLETLPEDRPKGLLSWADDLEAVAEGTGKSPYARHRHGPWARPVIITAVLVLLLAAIVGVAVDTGGSTGAPTATAYTFRPELYGASLLVSRVWSLSGTAGSKFEGVVSPYNNGTSTIHTPYYEVIPISVAPRAQLLAFSPKPAGVPQPDPVVRYNLTLAAGASTRITYTTDLGATHGSWSARLSRLAKDQEQAQIRYFKSIGLTTRAPKPVSHVHKTTPTTSTTTTTTITRHIVAPTTSTSTTTLPAAAAQVFCEDSTAPTEPVTPFTSANQLVGIWSSCELSTMLGEPDPPAGAVALDIESGGAWKMLSNLDPLTPMTAPGTSGTWSIWTGVSPCENDPSVPQDASGACGITLTVVPQSLVASQNGPWTEIVGLGSGGDLLDMTDYRSGTSFLQAYQKATQG
jgi:hypothetical protein